MSDLVEFLRARLDEDEQLALNVGPAKLGWGTYLHPDGSMAYTSPVASVEADDAEWVTDGKLTWPDAVTVVFDPARVLREVEAKREMLTWDLAPSLANDLYETLALPYSDHPDYCKEWA